MKSPEQNPNTIQTVNLCQHHWLIEEPNGPVSVGRCIKPKCEAVRQFRNWNPDADFITNTEHRMTQ